MLWMWLACTNNPTEETTAAADSPAVVSVSTNASSTKTTDLDGLKAEAIGVVKQVGSQLKPQLTAAMQSGGTVQAITVCAEAAPQIVQSVSATSGWTVKRVSLKARNDKTAIPDAWERETLAWFDAQQALGVDAATLVKSETVNGVYRLMKAQPVEGVCLSCHGATLSPETESALQQHYPNDVAKGYTLGEVRGAFSVSKVLD